MAQNLVELYPFTGPYLAFVHNHLKKHFWRVERFMGYDDAIQEAAWQFILLLRRMEKNRAKFEIQLKEKQPEISKIPPDKYLIKNPKHLMSLWVTNWTRHFHTLSHKNTKKIDDPFSVFVSEDNLDFNNFLEGFLQEENVGYMACLIRDAPKEVAFMHNLLFEAPVDIFTLALKTFEQDHVGGRGDKHLNTFVCKLGGFDQNIDIVSKFRQHFHPD